jgi:hypothetical protein
MRKTFSAEKPCAFCHRKASATDLLGLCRRCRKVMESEGLTGEEITRVVEYRNKLRSQNQAG